ncbi:MAG: hypothetical protein D6677_13810 [Calditrichaeota bacterium]|nr:MAG: hypothetical protein D6677_13810 [Calditrichota bacterium]
MKIGNEEYKFRPEPKKAMDLEIFILLCGVYAVVFFYAFDYLSWPVFYLLFHIFYMRVFIGNHDRMHADRTKKWPRPLELFFEHFAMVVTPWDEPFDSIRAKHRTHHVTHLPNREPDHNVLKDPHSLYEAKGFFQSFFYCLFYEEVQLIIDIKNKHITLSRLVRLIIYLPLQILFIGYFGWQKFLGVFFAVRIMSAMGWFLFSWFLHVHMYQFGILKQLRAARFIQYIFGIFNGRRVKDGFFHHAVHHAWPHVPSAKLHILDEALMRHPEQIPQMIQTH